MLRVMAQRPLTEKMLKNASGRAARLHGSHVLAGEQRVGHLHRLVARRHACQASMRGQGRQERRPLRPSSHVPRQRHPGRRRAAAARTRPGPTEPRSLAVARVLTGRVLHAISIRPWPTQLGARRALRAARRPRRHTRKLPAPAKALAARGRRRTQYYMYAERGRYSAGFTARSP